MNEENKLMLTVLTGLLVGISAPFALSATYDYFTGAQPYPTTCIHGVEYFLDGRQPTSPVIDPETMKPQRCEQLPLEKQP